MMENPHNAGLVGQLALVVVIASAVLLWWTGGSGRAWRARANLRLNPPDPNLFAAFREAWNEPAHVHVLPRPYDWQLDGDGHSGVITIPPGLILEIVPEWAGKYPPPWIEVD